MNTDPGHIDHYIQDGFVKVCDVDPNLVYEWRYKNINEEIMFGRHNSWIYFIVVNGRIVKIGESGNQLGIRMAYDNQPITGSKSRLGRYRNGDGTDASIRNELREDLRNGQVVSIWAKKCQIYTSQQTIAGNAIPVNTTIHKALEYHYLDYFETQVGHLPTLNKSRK